MDPVIKKIVEQFPEFEGVEPEIREEEVSHPSSLFAKAGMLPVPPRKIKTYTFRKKITLPDGTEHEKILRATVDDEGEIKKITVSK
ncbi:hypothetical protein DRQ20_07205 [bacterium]|nr:MAG: hypothetical protein DRQ20_07205 [bacterium]